MSSHFVGMMSGTSLDAVDAALINFDNQGMNPRLIKRYSINLPDTLKEQLTFLAHTDTLTFRQLAEAEDSITRLYTRCALQLIEKLPENQLPLAFGCHGQTIEHQPYLTPSYSLQLFNPSLFAELTQQNIIADFRRRDLAAGGQGAPLVPAFHSKVFHSNSKDRIIINLGGIANVTFLPKDSQKAVTGFDTGPANLLLDHWYQTHWKGSFDNKGTTASKGEIIQSLLNKALTDDYFSLAAPKSTGREKFNPEWLKSLLATLPDKEVKAEDVLRTLIELTAVSLTDQVKLLDPKEEAELYICGGGWQNNYLIERVTQLAAPRQLASTEKLGIPPQDVEAAAFAWLAWRHYNHKSGNLPSATGAKGERILGGFYPA